MGGFAPEPEEGLALGRSREPSSPVEVAGSREEGSRGLDLRDQLDNGSPL